MAVTQAAADKGGMTLVATKDTASAEYYGYKFGPIQIFCGTGSPHSFVTAAIGSLAVNVGTGLWYINTTGSTTWALVSSQTA